MIFRAAVVVLAVPVLLLLLGVALLVLSLMPPLVSWVSVAVMAVVAVWAVLRRRTGAVSGSETALMGTQRSKDGLL